MDQIEIMVNPKHFFRINRKQIVFIDAIEKIANHFNNRLKLELVPVATQEILVSRSRVKQFKAWLNE